MKTIRRLAPLAAPFLALWLGACAGGPEPRPGPTPRASDPSPVLPLEPAVVERTLPNGFTYLIRENGRPENRALLWLVLDAGSMQEDDDQRGLAHFVEHMAFNGTRHFAKQELVDFLEGIGMRFGADINAYTSFDETVYMLQVPTDEPEPLKTALLILQDWAGGITFDGEEIEDERGILLEEWRLGQGAGARIRDRQWPVLFHGSRYAERLPIGDEDIIQGAPHETLRRFYRDWYRPDLMALVAVGDFDAASLEAQVRRRFRRLRGPRNPRSRSVHEVPDHDETLFAVVTDPEVTRTTVGVYYKLPLEPFVSEEDFRRQIVEDLHHGMLGARLDEVRRRPDPPFLFAFTSSGGFVRSRNVYRQEVVVPEGGALQGLGALLTEVERVDRHGFTGTEMEREKKEYLRAFEQVYRERDKRASSTLARELRDHFLEDEPVPGIEFELDLVERLLPTITLDEVNALTQAWIRDENRVVLFSGPEDEAVPPPTEEELLAVLEAVRVEEVEPYVDRVRQGPLVAQRPTPGTITAERRIDEIDVTEWQLSNGARVVLKPTRFRNDEILLAGFSPGGHSLVPDEEHTSAAVATALLNSAGLGEFGLVELGKALAGTVAGAHAFIGELEESVQGGASPEDLETMFELLYLRFTAPRREDEAFRAWIDRQRASLENREASPAVVFGDEMRRTLSGNHPRRRPWTTERLDEIDPGAAMATYRDRFADAGDFTFVLVGNLDMQEIRPLVATWLGGLPATGRQETWRDVGVHRPEGVVAVDVRKGIEPKSQVRLIFHGPTEWSRERVHDIASLSAALRIRLREVLREDMGATYGVAVDGTIARWPREQFQLRIAFGCAPESVEALIEATFQEIERFKGDGPPEAVAAKVREAQTRQREVDLKENGFWLGTLSGYYRNELDPREILAFDGLVESVSPERIREAARRDLPEDRYVRGVLWPEEAGDPLGISSPDRNMRD